MNQNWSGFSKGEAVSNYYEKDFTYSCPDPGNNYPTKTTSEYDPSSGYTTASITGPLLDCSGESFLEKSDHSKGGKSKSGKAGKTKKTKSMK